MNPTIGNIFMTVKEIAAQLNLHLCCGETGQDRQVTGGYTSDLLSDVVAHAPNGNIWITLHTHPNIVAVATLKKLSAILLVQNLQPTPETVQFSNLHNIPIFSTPYPAFEISAKLYHLLNPPSCR